MRWNRFVRWLTPGSVDNPGKRQQPGSALDATRQAGIAKAPPTSFELAILGRIADRHPELLALIPTLQVRSRQYSGAGSFTSFEPHPPLRLPDGYIGLDALIHMPGLEHGMGASLAVDAGQIDLEIYTYGTVSWSGDFSGFRIDGAE